MFTDHSQTGMYEINCEIVEAKQVVLTKRNIEKKFKYDFSHLKYQRVETSTPA